MATKFENRCYGAVVLRSINSNWNADFTHYPRILPNGVIYATDKALKYAIKRYLLTQHNEKVFYIRRFKEKDEEIFPNNIDDTYQEIFSASPDYYKNLKKKELLKNLLECIDIRLFGATYAGTDKNLSIHGVVQINHAVNRFPSNEYYTEQISAPFTNIKQGEAAQTTLGSQTNVQEAHYVYHFSINPQNLFEYEKFLYNDTKFLASQDIALLKEAFNRSVTMLDSSRKIGTDNEATIFVTLKGSSRLVLPNFTELIDVYREDSIVNIDCTRLFDLLNTFNNEIEKIEIYYDTALTKILGIEKLPNDKVYEADLNTPISS